MNFLLNGDSLDCFLSPNVINNVINKITVTYPKSEKMNKHRALTRK